MSKLPDVLERISALRQSRGFLTPEELLALSTRGNVIHDPFSTLISSRVRLGAGNVIYPNVVIECGDLGVIVIGDDNVMFPGTLVIAEAGTIEIGNANQFGEQGVSIRAVSSSDRITIGDQGRYLNGVQILGSCELGSGSQLLSRPLVVQDCILEEGGSWRSDDPDARAGVIKGTGIVRGLKVARGEVVNGQKVLTREHVERQVLHHPPSVVEER